MEFLNFDLRVSDWDPASQQIVVEVLLSPAGESRQITSRLLMAPLTERLCPYATPAQGRQVGIALAHSILVGEVLTLWNESRQIARERDMGLRLQLHLDGWELGRVPWELLYDERRDEHAVFDNRVSLVRYIRLQAAPPSLRPALGFTVLAVAATPVDAAPLSSGQELGHLRDALSDLAGQRMTFAMLEHATLDKLRNALLDHAPDVVHFVGHATYDREQEKGYLVLEDERGRCAPLAANDAARLLSRYGANLVVLNACETAVGAWAGLGPALVRAEIPAVVAMQWPVEDHAATAFSRSFYRALSLGKTVDECVGEGRVGANVLSPEPCDWAAAVLFMRSHSGSLWARHANGHDMLAHRPETFRPAPALVEEPEPLAIGRGPLFKTHGPLLPTGDRHLIVARPELRQALRLAQQPSVTQYIALLSARQTGKTTLLLQLLERLRDRFACVFVDLSVLRGQDAASSFRLMASRLHSALGSLINPSVRLPDLPTGGSPLEFLEFLEALARALPTPRIVLLMDEVGALTPEVSDVFFNALRAVFTQGRGGNDVLAKYLFVFSGAVDLYSLTFGTTSPLNICEKLYLGDFGLEDVQRLVNLFQHLNVPVEEGVAERLYSYTRGHPYLTMRMCALIEAAGVERITPDTVEAAIRQVLVEDDNVRFIIHELELNVPARRRLYDILIEGREVSFSRNDPVLAGLEMLGVIRPAQPCRVRNELYAMSLRSYLQERGNGSAAQSTISYSAPAAMPAAQRALNLRPVATLAQHPTRADDAWASYLREVVWGLDSFAELRPTMENLPLVLQIKSPSPDGFWDVFAPRAIVSWVRLGEMSPDAVRQRVLREAQTVGARLALVLVYGQAAFRQMLRQGLRGVTDGVTIVPLDDEEVAATLAAGGDLEPLLRSEALLVRAQQ